MPRERIAPTWLNPFGGLIRHERGTPPAPALRRLRGERLEERMVLSTAPLAADAPQSQSLADYLAQQHSMGPALPSAEVAPAPAAGMDQLAAAPSPVSIDQWFSVDHGEGEGGGGGSGSGSGGGSGSGSGAASGSGSGAASGTGSGSGGASGSGSGTGGASGSGSGAGGSSASGSSNGDPDITDPEVDDSSGNIVVTGFVDDDGGLGNLAMTLDGGTGSITINNDGSFTVDITDTQGNNTFTITATDSDGNTTSFTFTYNG
jgi:hypothetical protein